MTSAALLLREHGVSGTSFAKVLEHSSTPRGSVAHHFPGGKRELVADAVGWAGEGANRAIRHSIQRGDSPAELFSRLCDFYGRALVDRHFAAGCPVGAVAQEAYDDPVLRAAVADVFDTWQSLLEQSLAASGRELADARDLASLCIAGLEGALMLARVQQSAEPLERAERQLRLLLQNGPEL